MATELPTDNELLEWHKQLITNAQAEDNEYWDLYNNDNEIPYLNINTSPNNRIGEVNVNMYRKFVNTKNDRMQIRALIVPGGSEDDNLLMEAIRQRSKLDSEFGMFNIDRLVPGHGYLSIDRINEQVRISARSPRKTSVLIDEWTGEVTSGAVMWKSARKPGAEQKEAAILYTPQYTKNFVLERDGWKQVGETFQHNLGVTPLVAHFNQRTSDGFTGTSGLKDLVPIVESLSDSLSNMKSVMRAHGSPWKYISGLTDLDLVDDKGQPRKKLDMYQDMLTLLGDAQAKVGQLLAADASNFQTATTVWLEIASGLSNLPVRDLGLSTANPPAEGAIIASEISLVRDLESDCTQVGVTVSQAATIAYQMETGKVLDVPVRVEWQDPATPTVSQRTDADVKLKSVGAISNETIWENQGKDQAWIAREKARLAAEMAAQVDPTMSQITQGLAAFATPYGELGEAA